MKSCSFAVTEVVRTMWFGPAHWTMRTLASPTPRPWSVWPVAISWTATWRSSPSVRVIASFEPSGEIATASMSGSRP